MAVSGQPPDQIANSLRISIGYAHCRAAWEKNFHDAQHRSFHFNFGKALVLLLNPFLPAFILRPPVECAKIDAALVAELNLALPALGLGALGRTKCNSSRLNSSHSNEM